MQPKVSIIIVNYNSQQTIGRCIDALYKYVSGIAYEIIVIDNASSTESVRFIRENYPGVKLIINDENKGFGAANNIGVHHASGDYLFFLNPDTILLDNAVLRFYRFLEEEMPDTASCGGNLIKENGEPVTAYGNFPSLLQEVGYIGFYRFFSRYYAKKLRLGRACEKEERPFQAPFITGADIFIRKDIFQELGGFDEKFFLYYEETDLFYRLQKAGYVSYVLPDVKIIHLEGTYLLKNNTFNYNTWAIWEKSRYYYFRKHKGLFVTGVVKSLQLLSFILQKIAGNRTFQLGKVLKITWKA